MSAIELTCKSFLRNTCARCEWEIGVDDCADCYYNPANEEASVLDHYLSIRAIREDDHLHTMVTGEPLPKRAYDNVSNTDAYVEKMERDETRHLTTAVRMANYVPPTHDEPPF